MQYKYLDLDVVYENKALSLGFYSSKNRAQKNQIDVVHTTVIFGWDSGEGVSDSLQQNEQPHRR